MEQHYIGILISAQLYRKLDHGKQSQILSFYEEAGKINNVIPVYLRLEDLQPGELQTSGYVMNSHGKYQKTNIPKPFVIHNRGYQSTKAAKKQIISLQAEGLIFFNEWNHYGKYKIHKLLIVNEEIRPHLPETVRFNHGNMVEMMGKHSELIIKPSSGTFGKRNMKATRLNETEWLLSFPLLDLWQEEMFPAEQIPQKIQSLVTSGKYIIQERIQLAEYKHNPFDLRVTVQRNGDGEWQVTGMVGRVAKTGSFVTNVARGGTSVVFEDILSSLPHLNERQVVADVERLSLRVAKKLGDQIANFADIGLDVGITMDGFPMFIECNARDLRLAFRKALMFETWRETYITPISYGKYLLTMRNGK
ncbi:YheC/YheD family protein [Neobacillus drentensis]|uniref:YheC/YheD family endospore coat-associated protein n=1 Tax=Neobacillus drentensis TaxID=220684 RepID=UPI002FFEE7CE